MQRTATRMQRRALLHASPFHARLQPPQIRESPQSWENVPEIGPYVDGVPAESAAALDRRRRDFGAVVKRIIDAAQARGMTTKQIEDAGGVKKSMYYRWIDGDWQRDPNATLVRSFCNGLGGSISEAYRALGWTEQTTTRKATEPIIEDPDLRALMHKLSSPKTPAAEKLLIRRMIRAWIGKLEQH